MQCWMIDWHLETRMKGKSNFYKKCILVIVKDKIFFVNVKANVIVVFEKKTATT